MIEPDSDMQLFLNPSEQILQEAGQVLPDRWRKRASPWAELSFRETETGSVLLQELIYPDLTIYSWTLDLQEAVILYPAATHPTISLRCNLQGNVSSADPGFDSDPLRPGNYDLVYIPTGMYPTHFAAGLHDLLYIELSPDHFEEIAGMHPEVSQLFSNARAGSVGGVNMIPAAMNYVTGNIIRSLRSCDKTGAALHLDMHKYVLALLSEYFSDLLEIRQQSVLNTAYYARKIGRIREYILSAPNVHEHSVERIAKKFGISVSLLKREFKKSYGTTLSVFVRHHAILKSHLLLTTTKMSIEEIATEVGYAWRPAFEDAFKKQFHLSPAAMRLSPNQ